MPDADEDFECFTIEIAPLRRVTTWDEIDEIEARAGDVNLAAWVAFKGNAPALAQRLEETMLVQAGIDASTALAIAQTTARTLVRRGELVPIAQHDARACTRIAVEMDRTERLRQGRKLTAAAKLRIKRAQIAEATGAALRALGS